MRGSMKPSRWCFYSLDCSLLLGLASYHPLDPSWNTVTGAAKAANLTGRAGAFLSDLFASGVRLRRLRDSRR